MIFRQSLPSFASCSPHPTSACMSIIQTYDDLQTYNLTRPVRYRHIYSHFVGYTNRYRITEQERKKKNIQEVDSNPVHNFPWFWHSTRPSGASDCISADIYSDGDLLSRLPDWSYCHLVSVKTQGVSEHDPSYVIRSSAKLRHNKLKE